MKRLKVMMTRTEISPGTLEDSVAVVLDVVLATTTLATILENGARRVFVAEDLEGAERLYAPLGAGALRGGEQQGLPVEGYDLGPIPSEYAPEVVGGRDLVFLTTNGTRALAAARGARVVLAGCLRNAPVIARHVDSLDVEEVSLVCAGSRGSFSYEDFAGAAEIISRLDLSNYHLSDSALLAREFHERHEKDPLAAISSGRVGRMFAHRMPEVCRYVADVGASEAVPELRDEVLGLVEEAGEAEPPDSEGVRDAG